MINKYRNRSRQSIFCSNLPYYKEDADDRRQRQHHPKKRRMVNNIFVSTSSKTILVSILYLITLIISSSCQIFVMSDDTKLSRMTLLRGRNSSNQRQKTATTTTTKPNKYVQWNDPIIPPSSEEFYNDWATKSNNKPDDDISQSKRKILWLGPMPKMLNPWEHQQELENELQQSSFKRRKELLHPLRTNQWEFNIHWFHHHHHHYPQNKNKSSNNMMMIREKKTTTVIIELDYPTGYCRVFPKEINDNDKKKNIPIGIGRWTKRPWGITIRIHPLEVVDSTSRMAEGQDDNNQKRRFSSSDNNPALLKLDPQREYILCASAFHWNGFGEQPKLTQGTILQQKPNSYQEQQSKNNRMLSSSWWIWYENEDDDDYESYYDKMVTRVHNARGRPVISSSSSSSNMPTLKGKLLDYYQQSNRLVVARNVIGWVCSRRVTIPNFHGQWFRPVVGSFSGKGIGDDTSKSSLT